MDKLAVWHNTVPRNAKANRQGGIGLAGKLVRVMGCSTMDIDATRSGFHADAWASLALLVGLGLLGKSA